MFCASSSLRNGSRSSTFLSNIASVASSALETADEVTPTSRAATRPGMAAGVSTSAGRARGREGIKSSGSHSVAGSAELANSNKTSRTALCPAVASPNEHQEACEPAASNCARPQHPQMAQSGGPPQPNRTLTASVNSRSSSIIGPCCGASNYTHPWQVAGLDRSSSLCMSGKASTSAKCLRKPA